MSISSITFSAIFRPLELRSGFNFISEMNDAMQEVEGKRVSEEKNEKN